MSEIIFHFGIVQLSVLRVSIITLFGDIFCAVKKQTDH